MMLQNSTCKKTDRQVTTIGLGSVFQEAVDSLVNKRTRHLTALGWLALLLVFGFVLTLGIRAGRSAADPTRGLMSLNPRFKDLDLNGASQPESESDRPQRQEDVQKGSVATEDKETSLTWLPEADLSEGQISTVSHKVPNDYGRPNSKDFPVGLIHEPTVTCQREILLLLLVRSRPENVGGRNAIRRTWGVYSATKYRNVTPDQRWVAVFLLGRARNRFDDVIKQEAEQHGDVLQGDFQDTPYEDTRKLMMALVWTVDQFSLSCSARFVLKTTDNIYHNMPSFLAWLTKKFDGDDGDIFMGKLLRMDRPIRDPSQPLYVPRTDFPMDFFPDILRAPVYLFSYDVCEGMRDVMDHVVPIAMEDGYVGLLAEKLGVPAQHNERFQMVAKTSNVCQHLKMFFIFDVKPEQHLRMYFENRRGRASIGCLNAQWLDQNFVNRPIQT